MNGKATKADASSTESGRAAAARERLGISAEEFRAMGRMGAMYYQQGLLDKARTIFEGLVEIDPDSAAAHSALGALHTRTEQFDAALRHLNRAVELAPEQIAPYVNRAEIFIKQGQAEEAVENLKRAIALDPQEKDPAANRARAMALGIAEALKARGVTGQPKDSHN
ncbi:MAG TPA: tetratricopeptide repeat protein [Pyrinomonadaceae bacterium]|nr:tetratricopeptide repeat protein [Pyrinomonadaceae bacterium]